MVPLPSNRHDQLMLLAHTLNLGDISIPLLNQSLTHSSYLNENSLAAVAGNERLEFLGDAVLGLVVTDYLYQSLADQPEGSLSKIKAVVVSARILARVACELELGENLYLGRGEDISGGRKRESILSACYESVLGAVYLSLGFDRVRDFILATLQDELDLAISGGSVIDHKSLLQELTQRDRNVIPRYRVVAMRGPDHAREFEIEVRLGTQLIGRGAGQSKKAAEQHAAAQALAALGKAWNLDQEPGA